MTELLLLVRLAAAAAAQSDSLQLVRDVAMHVTSAFVEALVSAGAVRAVTMVAPPHPIVATLVSN